MLASPLIDPSFQIIDEENGDADPLKKQEPRRGLLPSGVPTSAVLPGYLEDSAKNLGRMRAPSPPPVKFLDWIGQISGLFPP
jgi:hypothetical protein